MDVSSFLRPNQLITLEISDGNKACAYASRIENLTDDTISVAAPMERGALVVPRPGTSIKAYLSNEQGRYFFISTVIAFEPEPIPILILRKPQKIEKGQRRHFLRVNATVFPVESWLLDPDPGECRQIRIAIVDISGGGIRFVGGDRLPIGALVRIRLDLPFGCGTAEAVAKVLRVEERSGTTKSRYETAAVFTEISEGDRDRICKFVLRQQLEMIKRGIKFQ